MAAQETGRQEAELAEELERTVASAKSVKAALDVDWRLPGARTEALNILIKQFERLRSWLEKQFSTELLGEPPLSDAIELVEHLVEQDTEPDPNGGGDGRRRLRQGGKDRQVSISDPDMRHGRKSRKRLFVGYKRHVSVDVDIRGLVRSVRLLPANVAEHEAAGPLLSEVEAHGRDIGELHFDRGYLPSKAIHRRRASGMRVVTKPPTPSRPKDRRLSKADPEIDLSAGQVTCPGGVTEKIKHGKSRRYAAFRRSLCQNCKLAGRCLPKSGQRSSAFMNHEELHQKWAAELATPEGRARRRKRVLVEHALARLGAIQGTRARYRGLAKNQAHMELCAAVANFYVLDQLFAQAA